MAKTAKASQLRIIGGRWRGRKIVFTPLPGLRPTPDRLRETLFNWLMPSIQGARCLDLFAGSGALGFEALSRGASEVHFVEQDKATCRQLRDTAKQLETQDALVHCDDGLNFLQSCHERFDIIFLDPPFQQNLLLKSLHILQQVAILSSEAWIYCEGEKSFTCPSLPSDWTLWRERNIGDVHCMLLKTALP